MAATILLVDDDPAVRESLGRVLAIEGWRVVTAASGEEALARLAVEELDLMITDLRMTDISGWDLLFHENMQRPTLPVFVITALPPTSAGGADHFATAFFQKPLDLDALVLAIRGCLDAAGRGNRS
jgi:DNA-binding NtrC family response regulator